jgi:hypothetical protein
LLAALFASQAHAYRFRNYVRTARPQKVFTPSKKSIPTPYQSVMSARCIAYIAGFADGYAISDYPG